MGEEAKKEKEKEKEEEEEEGLRKEQTPPWGCLAIPLRRPCELAIHW